MQRLKDPKTKVHYCSQNTCKVRYKYKRNNNETRELGHKRSNTKTSIPQFISKEFQHHANKTKQNTCCNKFLNLCELNSWDVESLISYDIKPPSTITEKSSKVKSGSLPFDLPAPTYLWIR